MPKPPKEPPGQQLDNRQGGPKTQFLRRLKSELSVAAQRPEGDILPQGWRAWRPALMNIIDGATGRRGRHVDPETELARAKTFELLDAEVAAGRDPYHKKVATPIARSVMKDAGRVRQWRNDWNEERQRN